MSIIKSLRSDIASVKQVYQGLGIVGAFFTVMQGRATAFAIVFTVCGLIGFFKKYDLTSYALFIGAIQAMVVAHSIKEDYFQRRGKDPQ